MAESELRKWPLPDQNTSPPDVVRWLDEVANAADSSFLWGAASSCPASLPAGTVYFGW